MKNLLLLILPILLLACSKSESEPGTLVVLTGMELVAVDKTLTVGDKYQMKVNFTPSNVGNLQCEWKSSDVSVATVSQKGVVEVKGYGVSSITATYGGLTSNTSIAIHQPQDYTSFVVTNATASIDILRNVVVGHLLDGKYYKLAELGDLKNGVPSREVKVDNNTIRQVYVFMDYVGTVRVDIVFALKNNAKNHLIIPSGGKGIAVTDKTDPTQYPQ